MEKVDGAHSLEHGAQGSVHRSEGELYHPLPGANWWLPVLHCIQRFPKLDLLFNHKICLGEKSEIPINCYLICVEIISNCTKASFVESNYLFLMCVKNFCAEPLYNGFNM